MLAILATIMSTVSAISADLPEFLQGVAIVKSAIAAIEGNDQAALDKADADANALADSLKPAGV